MDYKEVQLTDGRVVKVYRPPSWQIMRIIEKRYPEPEVPVVKETTKAGAEIVMRIVDDPDYLRAHAEWERVTGEEADKLGSLFMLKAEQVPEDWDVEVEVGERVRLFDPDWQPREGAVGRKLDYIEWDIMGDPVNATRIRQTLLEMSSIDLEEVRAVQDSFRDQVEGETA